LQNKTQYGTDNGTIDPSCNMPTPTIRSRRGSNVRFHKGDEMTPEAHTTYRPGRLVYTRYAATIQILLTQSVISTSICISINFLSEISKIPRRLEPLIDFLKFEVRKLWLKNN